MILWNAVYHDDEDDEPTLGVREPRWPRPSSWTGGAAAELYFTAEQEAEGIAQGARVNGYDS